MLVGFVGEDVKNMASKQGGQPKNKVCKGGGGGSPTSSIAKVLTLMQRHLFAF